MADPALTDANRDDLFERLGVLAGMWESFEVQRRLYHPDSDEIVVWKREGDEGNTLLTDIQFTACVMRTDTDADGRIYGAVVDESPGAGQATVNLYNDSGRTTLVSTGNAADGGTITLTAQAGYNLAGTIDIGTISGNFNFQLVPVKAFAKRLQDEFPGTNTAFDADARVRNAMEDGLQTIYDLLGQCQSVVSGVNGIWLRELLLPLIVGGSDRVTALSSGLEQANAGNVTYSPTGLLEDLRRAMQDNTGGSGVVKVGPGTFGTANSFTGWSGGRLSGSITTTDRVLIGTTQFTCVSEMTANRAPRFKGVFRATDPRIDPIDAELELVVNQLWQSPRLGLSLTVQYAPTITNETGTAFSTTSTDWSVSGLRTGNSDSGQLWMVVHTDGTTVRFYDSEANRDTNDGTTGLVTQATGVSTSTAFTSADTGTGLVVTGKMGGTINSGDEGNVDYNVPQKTQPFSYFTVTTTLTTSPSEWQALVRDGLFGSGNRYRLHSAATPNIVDGLHRAGQLLNGDRYGDPL